MKIKNLEEVKMIKVTKIHKVRKAPNIKVLRNKVLQNLAPRKK